MLGPGLCWSSLARQPGEGVARARGGLVGKGWIEFQGRKGRIRGLGVGPGRAGADRTGTEKAHPHHGQQRGCDVQGARVPAEEQALWGRRAGPCLVQLRGTQRPRPQVEVGEVAAEGVSRREATAQGVLILAQHQDAAGRHRVAGAQSPRPSAPPPVGEQRPAPTPLLPRGAHMVPAAVGAEGCEEGRVVPMHYQRSAHYAPWLGEGAQLQRVGQRGARQRRRARRGRARHSPTAREHTQSAPPAQAGGSAAAPRGQPSSRQTPARQWCAHLRGHVGRDLSFLPCEHGPAPALWLSGGVFPGFGVPPHLRKEEMRASVPLPKSQTPTSSPGQGNLEMQWGLTPGSFCKYCHCGLLSLKVPRASAPCSHFPGAHTHASVGVSAEGPLFGPPRPDRAAVKQEPHQGAALPSGQTAARRTLGPATSSVAVQRTCTPHLQSPPPCRGPRGLKTIGETGGGAFCGHLTLPGLGGAKDTGLGVIRAGWG